MIEALDTVSKLWPVVISLIGLVGWLVRIEANVAVLKQELARLQGKHDALDSEVMKSIIEVKQQLARIEGAMSAKSFGQ